MPVSPSLPGLLAEADQYLEEYPPNIEAARKCLEEAVTQDPENPQVLDATGAFFIEYDDERIGARILKKSIELAPNQNPMKYFYLGQLSSGREALSYYQAGIELSQRLKTGDGVVSAFCSVGELWMSEELCDEPEARLSCEAAYKAAVAADTQSIEALAGLAGFKKIVGDHVESNELCMRCLALLAEHPEHTDIPLPIRLSLARTMIDLELAEEALSLLNDLLDEDEEDVEIWFLVACAHLMCKDIEASTETVAHAMTLCKKDAEQSKLWLQNLKGLKDAINQSKFQ